jgi:acyl dehydratase
MRARALKSPPSLLPLYVRAAAPLIPGASLLPFVPGGGGDVPEVELTLTDVKADPEKVAAYAHVCGFALREHLPVTYPHVLAFPLHMAVMADGRFPFGAVGLVHVANRIVQRRPIEVGERLSMRVFPTALEPHPRGRTFTLVSEASVDGEVVWEGCSTMLRRGGGKPAETLGAERAPAGEGDATAGGGAAPADGETAKERSAADREDGGGAAPADGETAKEREAASEPLQPSASWRLPGDLGRRYAAVSGDRNPIHMHPLSAKLLGFPRAIAHGMWSKARCVAALESVLPDAFEVDVRFRKPILLPAEVSFASSLASGADAGGASGDAAAAGGATAAEAAAGERGEIRFGLSDARQGTRHLDGRVSRLGERRRGARASRTTNHQEKKERRDR